MRTTHPDLNRLSKSDLKGPPPGSLLASAIGTIVLLITWIDHGFLAFGASVLFYGALFVAAVGTGTALGLVYIGFQSSSRV
jgi:hypothetical protein